MTLRVLALDTAIATGCAFGVAGGKPHCLTVNLGKASWDTRFARMLRLVDHAITKFNPDLLAVEGTAAGSYGNPDLIGLAICARAQASLRGVRTAIYMPNSVRRHFLGKALTARDFPGRTKGAAKAAIKGQVIARCVLLGWDVADDNQADAAALFDFACSMESRSHQMTTVGGLFAGQK